MANHLLKVFLVAIFLALFSRNAVVGPSEKRLETSAPPTLPKNDRLLQLNSDHRNSLDTSPAWGWNTFLGGTDQDSGGGIAVDTNGNIYVSGYSTATWGSPIRPYSGSSDAFVAKFDGTGALQWNTFLGSSSFDGGVGIAVDSSGKVYVVGNSNATWGSPVRPFTGSGDAFVAKLDGSGALQWNTFLGADVGNSIAVDTSGNVYVAGSGYYNGFTRAFVAKLDGTGVLQWNTFRGGLGGAACYGIAVDASGNVYSTGYSVSYKPAPTYYFVTKDDGSGVLQWSASLGGPGDGIAVDMSGNVYVTGHSYATWGSPVRSYTDGADTFVAKLDWAGRLQWNTFLGGPGNDYGEGIGLDTSGNVYVTGSSGATWGIPSRSYSGSTDAFGAKLDGSGVLQWNTFLGGPEADAGYGIAVDNGGHVYVAGLSEASWGSPVRPYAGGISDAFVAEIVALGFVLSVTPDNRNVSSEPGTTTFDVSNTGAGTMEWTAAVTSGASWLEIQSGSSGANSGTITAAYIQNIGLSSRTGKILVTSNGAAGSPKDVIVSQAAVVAQPVLSVTPEDGFSSWGPVAGPFSPSSKDYVLQNTGGGSLSWTALKTQPWVALSQNGGTLNSGQATIVTVSIINPGPTPPGILTDTVTFMNTTPGPGNNLRSVALHIVYDEYVTVRGPDGWLYSRSMNTSEALSGWTKINGKTDVAPATAVFNNKLYLVVKNNDETKIWWSSMTLDGVWGDWKLMDGFTSDKPSVAVFNNKLYIAVRGTDDKIYFRSMTAAETFSPWFEVPGGLTSVAPAIHDCNGMLYLVVKDSGDNKIWWNKMDASEVWTAWNLMDGSSPSTASLAWGHGPGPFYIAVRGSDNRIYFRTMDLSGLFAPWSALVGFTDASPAIQTYNNKIYMVVKGNGDTKIWWNSMNSVGVWGTFALMDGLSPAAPSLAARY